MFQEERVGTTYTAHATSPPPQFTAYAPLSPANPPPASAFVDPASVTTYTTPYPYFSFPPPDGSSSVNSATSPPPAYPYPARNY